MPTKSHEYLPIGSKVERGDRQTHRQDGDFICLFPFLESRLTIKAKSCTTLKICNCTYLMHKVT
jgi:hypothetical protein